MMTRAISTLLLTIFAILALICCGILVGIVAGNTLAGWAAGFVLLNAQPVLITALLCLAGGLELRRLGLTGPEHTNRFVCGVGAVFVAAGAAFTLLRPGIYTAFSVHTSHMFLIVAIAATWLGTYLLRRGGVALMFARKPLA